MHCCLTRTPYSEMSLMAPLAKPMVPQPHGSVASLARSSSLEGSTVSDHLRSEGHGPDAWASGTRKDGTGQVRHDTQSGCRTDRNECTGTFSPGSCLTREKRTPS